MAETRPEPERIDLSRADDPRDVVHRAVACLARGGTLGLSTESLHGVAASALHPGALARIGRVAGPAPPTPLTLLLKGAGELADWIPDLSRTGRRLATRAWPGPLTLLFPGPAPGSLARRLPPESLRLLLPDASLAFGVSAHPFVREVLRLLPGPLAVSNGSASQPPGMGAQCFEETAGLAMIVDDGPARSISPTTLVRVEGDHWSILHPGAYEAATLTRMAGTIFLFVCTGNTCRSPMAEALCKVLLAQRIGCDPGELEGRGCVVLSAGIAASSGMPAAGYAMEVVRGRGGTLQHHASRQLTDDLIRHADHIIAMTGDHLEGLLDYAPEASPRTRLLHPEGGDIADPIGSDRATYLETAQQIERYLERLLDDLGF